MSSIQLASLEKYKKTTSKFHFYNMAFLGRWLELVENVLAVFCRVLWYTGVSGGIYYEGIYIAKVILTEIYMLEHFLLSFLLQSAITMTK